MRVPYTDPSSGNPLRQSADDLVDETSGALVAHVVDGIPRFVDIDENYAEDNFGWMWRRWDTLGGTPEALRFKAGVIAERSGFTAEMLRGKTLLECGCGRGDDTIVLLDYPVAELHSFDLTTAVDIAREVIEDDRLHLSQASITDIPYADGAFDVVYCHRVLQHTPDPVASLRSVCRKVRPGGIIFTHSYKRSLRALNQYKYKYRPITKRLDKERIASFLDRWGDQLYRVHERTRESNPVLIHALIGVLPLARMEQYGDFDRSQMIELSKLVTFDALTPTYDRPMTLAKMRATLESEGFVVEHTGGERKSSSAIWMRARRVTER